MEEPRTPLEREQARHMPLAGNDAPEKSGDTSGVGLQPPAEADPGVLQVHEYLLYGLSIPERALRSTSALLAGALHQSSNLLVPRAFRSSKTYSVFVQQMLDFLANDVGGVEAAPDPSVPQSAPVENFVARKTVGNFIEMAGMATLHLSPLTVLAIVSDVAYGSQTYLRELSDELKREGVIDPETTIDHASDLLDAVSKASSVTATAFDTPPLSVSGLQETLDQTRAAVSQLDVTRLMPQAEIARLWEEMRSVAQQEKVSIFDVSSTLSLYTLDKVGTLQRGALSSVTVAGNIFERCIVDYYVQGLQQIQQRGLYATLAESSRPFITAVWTNFSPRRRTITHDLLTGRLFRDWLQTLLGFFRRRHSTRSATCERD